MQNHTIGVEPVPTYVQIGTGFQYSTPTVILGGPTGSNGALGTMYVPYQDTGAWIPTGNVVSNYLYDGVNGQIGPNGVAAGWILTLQVKVDELSPSWTFYENGSVIRSNPASSITPTPP